MMQPFFGLSLATAVGLTLVLVGCTGSDGDSEDNTSASTAAVEMVTSATEPSVTTIATTTTSAVLATTAPVQSLLQNGDRNYEIGVFESVGYACDRDDTSECGDSEFELRRIWMGDEVEGDDRSPIDFVDFFAASPGFGDRGGAEEQLEMGLGARIEPTPNVHGLAGESFIKITLSGISASRFLGNWDIERGLRATWLKWDAVAWDTDEPVITSGPILTFPDGTGSNFITEISLIESGRNTMTWVIALNYTGPSQYFFHCSTGACQIRLAPAPQD